MRYTFILFGLCLATPLYAGEITKAEPGSFTWEENNVAGPVFEQTPQGWRIYTHIAQAVRIADQRGIQNARIIAEERAKAAMVSYMHEHATNFRMHVEADATKDSTTAGADGQVTAGTVNRTSLDALTQVQTSFASGDLYGVTVLGQDYDEKTKVVTVKVGMSSKSIAAAREMRRAMTEAGSDDGPTSASRNTDAASGSSKLPGSETHHLKSDDW